MFLLTISSNILSTIAGIGLAQGLILSLFIYFHPQRDHAVNKFLAWYMGILTFIMAGPFLLLYIPWHKLFFVEPLPYLLGPMMYLYIRSFKENITWKKAWPHFIVVTVSFVESYFWVRYLVGKYPDAPNIPQEGFESPVSITNVSCRYIHLVTYYFLSRRELTRYRTSIRQFFSETTHIDLRWGNLLVNGYILMVAVSFSLFLIILGNQQYFMQLYFVNIAVFTPYIYAITYKGITQPTIWQKRTPAEKHNLEVQIQETSQQINALQEKPKTAKPVLGTEKVNAIVARTVTLMEVDKLYQETELTLQDLALRLELPAHQVSYRC